MCLQLAWAILVRPSKKKKKKRREEKRREKERKEKRKRKRSGGGELRTVNLTHSVGKVLA